MPLSGAATATVEGIWKTKRSIGMIEIEAIHIETFINTSIKHGVT
jgi:hypothetical protein